MAADYDQNAYRADFFHLVFMNADGIWDEYNMEQTWEWILELRFLQEWMYGTMIGNGKFTHRWDETEIETGM